MPSRSRQLDNQKRDAAASPLMTPSDLAAFYKVSRRSIPNMLARGEIPKPTARCGRLPRWHREVIESHAAGKRPRGRR